MQQANTAKMDAVECQDKFLPVANKQWSSTCIVINNFIKWSIVVDDRISFMLLE